MVCVQHCGLWLPKRGLYGTLAIVGLDAFVPEPNSWLARLFPPAKCVQCTRTMAVRTEKELTFDFCAEHGVWLDAGELDAFDAKCAKGGWR